MEGGGKQWKREIGNGRWRKEKGKAGNKGGGKVGGNIFK